MEIKGRKGKGSRFLVSAFLALHAFHAFRLRGNWGESKISTEWVLVG